MAPAHHHLPRHSNLITFLVLFSFFFLVLIIPSVHATVDVEDGEDKTTGDETSGAENKGPKRAALVARMRIPDVPYPAEGQVFNAQVTIWNVGSGDAVQVKVDMPTTLHEFGLDVGGSLTLTLDNLPAQEQHSFDVKLGPKRALRIPYDALTSTITYKTKENEHVAPFVGHVFFEGGDLMIYSQSKAAELGGNFFIQYIVFLLLTGGSGVLALLFVHRAEATSDDDHTGNNQKNKKFTKKSQ